MEKEKCCGCRACEQICPKNCIKMIEDEYGFVYPEKDMKQCINCGLCEKVCPFINVEKNNKEDKKCYSLVNKEDSIVKNSSSGGAFSAIVQSAVELFNGKYKIYGCTMDDDFNVYHMGIDRIDEIIAFRKSKYVQSDMKDIHKLIKEDIVSGINVIFIGTPCQVSSVKKFLINYDEKKIVFIDIICHGVPNKKIFKKYIHDIEEKSKTKVLKYYFREKLKIANVMDLSAIKMVIKDKNEDIKNVTKYCFEDSYMRAFYADLMFRDSCYKCPYACEHRCSDITIGDFWGIKENKNGISLVIENTTKGKKIIENAKKYAIINCADFNEAKRHNKNLNGPTEIKYEREDFLRALQDKDFETVVNTYTRKKTRLSFFISKNLNEETKKKIKRIIRREK